MATSSVFINEFHYDNTGTDTGEFIELVAPITTDLTGWSLVLYNGANGQSYSTTDLGSLLTATDLGNGFKAVVVNYPLNGIQNGDPDGVALVNNLGDVMQFLSYEGTFTAINGPAAGMMSTDIGVSQNGTEPIGASLQLTGSGTHYEDFTWVSTTANTSGAVNTGQTFAAPITELFFAEYIEGSSNNKALEIFNGTGAAIDLSAESYSVQMYFNGNTTAGLTINLSGSVAAGDVFVLAQSAANATILAQADQTNGSGWFNGDDAIVLRKGGINGTVVDSIGQIGFDPGTEWGTGLTSTADNTLRRKTTVTVGDTNPFDGFDPSVEWEGFATDTFDDLGSYSGGGGTTATLSLTTSPTRFSEGAGANAATGTVTRTGDTTSALTVTLASDNTTEATVPTTVTIDAGQASATFAVAAVDDTIIDGAQTVTLTASANGFSPVTASLTVEDDDVMTAITKISQIQGSGALTLLGGNVVTVEAIVVGDFQSANGVQNLRGFYLQEEDSDIDNNSLTSEGLFIFDDTFGVDVNVGDLVQVTGRVAEFTSGTSSLTQLNNVSTVLVQSSGNTLPTAATINFPVMDPADLEAYEGMLVNIPDTLTVTEHFQLGRFGQVVLSADGPTNQAGTDGRLEQFTQFNAPSMSGYSDYLAEIAKRRIVLDDGMTVQNPDPIVNARGGQPLSATNTLRGGDTVAGLTGILDDRFGATNIGNYRIQATAPVDFQPTNPRPTSSPDVGGRLQIASFNVLNYFNGDGMGGGFTSSEQRGAQNLEEFNRQRDKTISAILGLNADVVGVIEIENDGYGPNSAIQDLVNGLNAVAGAGTYAFIDPGTPQLGTDAIAVGFIYKPGSVTPVGTTAVLDSSVDPRFDTSANRPALAQSFTENATGEVFTAVNNHLKSKGSIVNGESDIGDGQGNNNPTRTRAAEALVDWLATDPTGVGDADYLVMGDLNAYAQEDPLTAIESGADDLAGTADDYTNLLADSTYSFVFNGQWGSLDHALASGNLTSQVTGAAIWHINADEPNVLDYNTNFKSAGQVTSLYADDSFRSSDHDPVIVGLNLSTPKVDITGTPRRDVLTGTERNENFLASGGPDLITTGGGFDCITYTHSNQTGDTITDFEVGVDLLVLTDLLASVGYTGTDPLADGTIQIRSLGNSDRTQLSLELDRMGGGRNRFINFITFKDVDAADLSSAENFVF